MAWKIYCDLDGVLADFDRRFFEFSGKVCRELPSDEMWAIILAANDEEPFFANLDLMSDALVLWDYIKDKDTEILTASGRYPQGHEFAKQKHIWCSRLPKPSPKVNTTERGIEKCQYAKEGIVLIDDMKRNIDLFVEAGGTGIVHTSAADTIRQLKALGI